MLMRIDSPEGTTVKVTAESFNNGNQGDKDNAIKYLRVGNRYTIDKTDIGGYRTDVWIKEFPGIRFSSVQFETVEQKYYPMRLSAAFTTDDNNKLATIHTADLDVVIPLIPYDLAVQIVEAYNEKFSMETIMIPYSAMPKDIYGKPFIWKGMEIVKVDEQLWKLKTPEGFIYQSDKKLGNAVTVAFVPGTPPEWVKKYQSVKTNSAHSFTEGSDHYPMEENEPTIDEQIELIRRYWAHWNEPPYLGKIDVEKVIKDLVKLAKGLCNIPPTASQDIITTIQNAEAALGMLQAFKKEREVSAKDVAEEHFQSTNILKRLAKGLDNTSARGEAIAIIQAIEEMLKLRGV